MENISQTIILWLGSVYLLIISIRLGCQVLPQLWRDLRHKNNC